MYCVPPDPAKTARSVVLPAFDAAIWKRDIAKSRDFAKLLQQSGSISAADLAGFDAAARKDFDSIAVQPAKK